jgi:hypothetical protein
MAEPDYLANYVEVHERIERFYEKYPEGSLQCAETYIRQIDGAGTFLVYIAAAYRTPDDERPAHGAAWEPVPGHTPYTKNSELMNAETSAWGRAIAAFGFEVSRGIASANEVRARQHQSAGGRTGKPSPKQLDFLQNLYGDKSGSRTEAVLVKDYAADKLTGGKQGSVSKAIDGLQENPDEFVERLRTAAQNWADSQSDLPEPDTTDLPPALLDEERQGADGREEP